MVIVILFLIFIGGSVLLQVYLSKKENKWPGLILPAIVFLFSLVAVFNVVAFTSYTSINTVIHTDENGIVTEQQNVAVKTMDTKPLDLVFTVVSIFIVFNIPTVVLLGVYAAARGKQRQRKALEKTQVQDLE
jgi:hypothetical protein